MLGFIYVNKDLKNFQKNVIKNFNKVFNNFLNIIGHYQRINYAKYIMIKKKILLKNLLMK